MKKAKYIVAILALFNAEICSADVAKEMGKMFDSLNYKSNASGSASFNDQSGGYYSLGGVVARAPSRSANLANIQMPNFNFRCGAGNVFLGAFSFLSHDELIRLFKGAIPAAASYGLRLAMQTMLPQIHQVTGELQDMAQKVNSMNVNSCQMGEAAAGGIASKLGFSQDAICSQQAIGGGVSKDLAGAMDLCKDSKGRAKVRAKGAGVLGDALDGKFNLVWKAIRKNGFLNKDNHLAETYMTLSGSIIRGASGKEDYPVTLPSLGLKQDLVLAVLYGSEQSENAEMYKCDEYVDCLNPITTKFVSTKENALVYKVEKILTDLSDKLIEDNPPTELEKGFVNSTNIPIMKIMSVESAYKRGGSPISIFQYSEEIAYDILLSNLENILGVVAASVAELEKAQIDGDTIDRFRQDLRDVRLKIIEKRQSIYRRIHSSMDAIDRAKLQERELFYKFGRYANLQSG